ncbi:MAG: class I SAM-dependent methyltransferase [Halieaceae bacterium]|jgi:ubiquinone/menaquinone biosynthesis C-methylase UbiE|nr:class I SAM-dependent methyltransferase [Halieaceae bacterium]
MDTQTQAKWDKAAPNFDVMAGKGAEKRWRPFKEELFSQMDGKILFLALGTGLDIETFPSGKTITAIDISPRMLEVAEPRIASYPGELSARVMDVHDLEFADNSFDQIFTSCTFCSVPDPIKGLRSLRRVLKPGGQLFMFEHTGSSYYPFKPMMDLMTQLTRKIGPDMNRPTVDNVRAAGFQLREVNNLFLDVVKTIKADNPAQ